MRLREIKYQLALSAKRLLFVGRGEPYEFAGETLRFVPGTRPVRRKYLHSPNLVNRDDVLEVLWLEKHLRKGDISIDVGAHYGIYSVLMAARSSKVIAFEPDPYARQILAKNVALNPTRGSIEVEGFACADRCGEAILLSRGGQSNSSLVRSGVAKGDLELEEIHVRTITLDDYLENRSLHPQIVKIDAEGAEIRILSGAGRLLKSTARILCELHPYAWAEFGNSLEQLESLVTAAGRRICYLDSERKGNVYGMTELVRAA